VDPAIEPAELVALARKYATMRALRRAAPGTVTRATLQAFAHEFPGALAETDRIGDALLQARLDESATLAAHASDAPGPIDAQTLPTWAHAWILVHRALRGALAIKRRLRGARTIDDPTRATLRAAIERDADPAERAWLDRLDEIASPRDGRLLDQILADVTHALALDADLRELLMPRGDPRA
jgi:hypothetical protein